MKFLIVSMLSILPLSYSVADESMTHRNHSMSEMTSGHDAHYLETFSAHHADGIEMAKLALDKAQAPELREMAGKIIKDQSQEIKQMQNWKQKYFSNAQAQVEAPKKMDMSKLKQAEGKEFDSQFANMMAKHHKDGIDMSKAMLPQLRQEEIKNFAQKSITKQTKEMQMLKDQARKVENSKS